MTKSFIKKHNKMPYFVYLNREERMRYIPLVPRGNHPSLFNSLNIFISEQSLICFQVLHSSFHCFGQYSGRNSYGTSNWLITFYIQWPDCDFSATGFLKLFKYFTLYRHVPCLPALSLARGDKRDRQGCVREDKGGAILWPFNFFTHLTF